MTKLRERSHILLWVLLFFFVASMAVGGLVGGANIMDLIFGGRNIQLNAGRVGNKNITHRAYQFELNRQLNRMRDQGQTIDSRARQNAGDFAWNTLIDRELKNEKIKSLRLESSQDEVYNFLLYTPPSGFQTALINAGFFANDEGKFDLDAYQDVIINGALPVELDPLLNGWEIGARTFLAERKLQFLYNQLGSVNDEDVKRKYMKDSLSCTLNYIYIPISSVADSVIDVSDEEISKRYDEDKEDIYSLKERRTMEYVMFQIPRPVTAEDSMNVAAIEDSVMQLALFFTADAEDYSFSEALIRNEINKTDTINVHETFEANSGIPFQMGILRNAVRFAFDNSIGSISDPITAQNGIAVFHSLSEKGGDYKPLDNVRESIRRTLRRENKNNYAKSLLQKIQNKDDSWKELANSDSLLQYKAGETQKIGGSFPGIGRSNALAGTLMAMETGDVSGILETFNAVLMLRVTKKDEIDEAQYREAYNSIRDNLLATERSLGYTNWLQNARKSIEIEDYRSEVY